MKKSPGEYNSEHFGSAVPAHDGESETKIDEVGSFAIDDQFGQGPSFAVFRIEINAMGKKKPPGSLVFRGH